jgi:hypothetical protein
METQLRCFAARGDYELHWVVARDQADAEGLLTEWMKTSGAWREYLEQLKDDPEPWRWREFGPEEVLTEKEGADDGSDISMPVSEWIAARGRGHLSCGEIG